jgi:hypothetical protein
MEPEGRHVYIGGSCGGVQAHQDIAHLLEMFPIDAARVAVLGKAFQSFVADLNDHAVTRNVTAVNAAKPRRPPAFDDRRGASPGFTERRVTGAILRPPSVPESSCAQQEEGGASYFVLISV